MEWIQRIRTAYSTLAEQQRVVADFVLSYPDSVVMLTTSRIAAHTGVSEATVTRFCQKLGYDGWAHFQTEAQHDVFTNRALNKARRLETDKTTSQIITSVAQWDEDLIRQLKTDVVGQQIRDVAVRIAAARRIVVAGARSSFPMAQYLGHYLRVFLRNTVIVDSGGQWTDELRQVDANDVIVLFFFPRYTKGSLDLGEFASFHRIPLILVTDSEVMKSRIESVSAFSVPVYAPNIVDSKSAVFTLIHMLIACLGVVAKERIEVSLAIFEETAEQYRIFGV